MMDATTTYAPNAILHGAAGPTDHPEVVEVLRGYRLANDPPHREVREGGTHMVVLRRASGAIEHFHARYVTDFAEGRHRYAVVAFGELWCDEHDSTYPCPGPELPCPACGVGEIGYDTDAFDDAGGLNCNVCQTEFHQTDGGKLVPDSEWCGRCGDQGVCPDCVGG